MQDWLRIVEGEFIHPAILLWRAIELKSIETQTQKSSIKGPILDIGCAEGKITSIIFKNKQVFGLDKCWDLLSQNKKEGQELVLADGCYIPFKDSSFGTVFSNCVIEHIPDLDRLLDEVFRVLKKGGRLIFTVPSHKFPEYLLFPSRRYARFRMEWLNCFHCYNPQTWEEKLKEKGLTMTASSYYMSKKATVFWDFLAGLMFVFRQLRLNNMDRAITSLFRKRIEKMYQTDDASDGAGLCMIAQR